MYHPNPTRLRSSLRVIAASMLLAVTPAPAVADPPPWAPAHGYRAKHGKGHAKHQNHSYQASGEEDFGILDGACYREKAGAVVGGVVGAAAGSSIGKGDGRVVATVAGTAVGILVGAAVGRAMDQSDQQCVGQTLERSPDGSPVEWRDPETGRRYQVRPLRTYRSGDRYCRDYRVEARIDAAVESALGTACRDAVTGEWKVVS